MITKMKLNIELSKLLTKYKATKTPIEKLKASIEIARKIDEINKYEIVANEAPKEHINLENNVKERKRDNKVAVEIANKVLKENYIPTDEDKNKLARFTGYGGMGGLDNDEYFTPKPIATATWNALEVREGDKILDPCTGVGIFSQTAPKGVNIEGCDLNTVSSVIANTLNDNSSIEIGTPFEKFARNKEPMSYDGIMTNVPFGARSKAYRDMDLGEFLRNEDYFIYKSLQLLKGGKRGVFLTTSRTAQGKGNERRESRRKFLELATFIGGARLPSFIFKGAGTETVVDMLVFEKLDDKVIAKRDDIDENSFKEAQSQRDKDFLVGKYFDRNQDMIIGDFTSSETLKVRALETGEKLHHMKQRDIVEFNGTVAEAIAQYNNLSLKLKKTKAGFDYSKLVYLDNEVVSKEEVKAMVEAIDLVLTELESINYEGKTTLSDEGFLEAYDKVEDKSNISYRDSDLLTLRVRERLARFGSTPILNTLIFDHNQVGKKDKEDLIKQHSEELEYIYKNTRKIAKNKDDAGVIIYNALGWLSKVDFDAKKLVNLDESDEKDSATKKDIFEDKEATTSNDYNIYNREDFTEEELENSNNYLALKDGKIVNLNDFLGYYDGKGYYDLEEILDEKSLKRVKENYTIASDPSNYQVDLLLLERIFGGDAVRIEVQLKHKTLNSLLLNEMDKALKEQLPLAESAKQEKGLYSQFLRYSNTLLDNVVVPHFIEGDSLRLFDNDAGLDESYYDLSDEIKNKEWNKRRVYINALNDRGKQIIREEVYKFKRTLENTAQDFIESDEKLVSILSNYLEDKRIVSYQKEYSHEALNLNGTVKSSWLKNMRGYQNQDAQKYADAMQGTMAWDTGLGKTAGAFLTLSNILKRKKAKRVMYVVPNAILGKIKSNAKDFFINDFYANNLLVVDTKNIGDLDKLKKSREIKLLIISSSTLLSQVKLKNESIDKIYGISDKDLNSEIEIDNEFPNNISRWTNGYPTYDKKAIHFFEDLHIEACIIDETHHYKNAIASLTKARGLNPKASNEALRMLYFMEYIKGKRGDMRGVILATATPLTNSPSEILTNLVMGTDRKALKFQNIKNIGDFEATFYNVTKEHVLKLDGASYREVDTLKGVKNIKTLYMSGFSTVAFRNAETEQETASLRGESISVKPPAKEIGTQSDATSTILETYRSLTAISKNERGKLDMLMGAGTEPYAIILAKEFGEIFGFISKAKNLSINKDIALGYTKLKLNKKYSDTQVYKVVGKDKVEVKVPVMKRGRFEGIKKDKVALSVYSETEYYMQRKEAFPDLTPDIVDDDYLNIPSIDYKVVEGITKKLEKAKMIGTDVYSADDYPTIRAMINNIKKEYKRHPNSKQIIYSTTLVTHSIITRLLKKHVKECKKIWVFNGATANNNDKRIKLQEEFNSFEKFGIMIFGKSGEVGVDFNINVCAVHLLSIGDTPDARHQAKGRAERQGNKIDIVHAYKYSQAGTFDDFLENLVERKAGWINAVREGKATTEFNDDSLEQLANQAEKLYGHLDISVEEKINMYLDKRKEERQRESERLALLKKGLEFDVLDDLISNYVRYFSPDRVLKSDPRVLPQKNMPFSVSNYYAPATQLDEKQASELLGILGLLSRIKSYASLQTENLYRGALYKITLPRLEDIEEMPKVIGLPKDKLEADIKDIQGIVDKYNKVNKGNEIKGDVRKIVKDYWDEFISTVNQVLKEIFNTKENINSILSNRIKKLNPNLDINLGENGEGALALEYDETKGELSDKLSKDKFFLKSDYAYLNERIRKNGIELDYIPVLIYDHKLYKLDILNSKIMAIQGGKKAIEEYNYGAEEYITKDFLESPKLTDDFTKLFESRITSSMDFLHDYPNYQDIIIRLIKDIIKGNIS